MYFIVNVEGAIFKDGRYLLITRGAEETHAAGTLSLVGGKVEADASRNVLEETLRREIQEEVGIEIKADLTYVESNSFVADDGDRVVDVVFLCFYKSSTPTIADPGEVAAIHWMTPDEIRSHLQVPPWTRQSIERAEHIRRISE